MTNILCQFIFNKKISFQKPTKARELIIKVIEAEVIWPRTRAFRWFLFNFVLILIVCIIFLGNVCNILINSGIVLLVRLNLVLYLAGLPLDP